MQGDFGVKGLLRPRVPGAFTMARLGMYGETAKRYIVRRIVWGGKFGSSMT